MQYRIEIFYRLFAASFTCLMVACASVPTTSSINPWEYPNRRFSIPLGAEQDRFIASLRSCTDYANATFPDALIRYEAGQLRGAGLIAKVIDDEKFYAWIRVHIVEGELVSGQIAQGHIIDGKPYAAGSRISVKSSDIVDWYIVHKDRPPEGNFIGKYMLLKQDGLAPGDCNPDDAEFQHYRYFSTNYSFVPPGTDGWDMRGPEAGSDMSMQEKGNSLDELNTLVSFRYQMPAIESIQELVNQTREHMEFAPEDTARYNVLKHEVSAYPKNETQCVLSQQVVEDKKALLLSGKRGPMIREVQTLMCLHPYEKNVGVKLNYSHRYHAGNRDREFVGKAKKVFESLAFTKKN